MKYNLVFLYGRIKDIKITSKAICEIEVIKGKRSCGNINVQQKHDIITVITDDSILIEEISTWEINDMVEIKGNLITESIPTDTVCRYCGATNIKEYNFVYVKPVYLSKREKGINRKNINQLLYERREISNQVVIGGTLSTPVQKYVGKDKIDAAIYIMKTEKKNKDLEKGKGITDSFLVRSYSFNANQDTEHLKKGESVFIDGTLQSQKTKHNNTCPCCGNSYNWTTYSLEIIPYNTEYITQE